MSITRFVATATTCDVAPGEERVDAAGLMHIHARVFSDIVQSSDRRIAGSNRVVLDIDFDPKSGKGNLVGRFVLTLDAGGGWEGELAGELAGDAIEAEGLARGTGALGRALLRVDFHRVMDRPGPHPCAAPKAFFDMVGFVLEPG